jgi:cytochrome c oxidase assembly protein subunit 15
MASRAPAGSAALVTGFGTALAMWTAGFAFRLPPAWLPSPALLGLLLALLAAGGAVAARATGAGPPAGAAAGLVASLVNLLVLGSLLSGDQPNALAPSLLLWVPGSLLLGAACGAVGGAAAGRAPAPGPPPDWTAAFARVAALATLVLVLLGGLVTSHEAGLAVVDWPNSYGYNMFLYPLSRMVGGIYYEHAHRLFGSLVGLTTVALFARLAATERRGWVKAAGAAAVLLVAGQGILGGLRVTGHFTMTTSPEAVRPSLTLAMVHGITGQLFFAWMVCLAAFTSPTWKERRDAAVAPGAAADRGFAALALAVLLVQLVLGVRARHTGEGTMLHMAFAVVVLAAAVIVAVRVMGAHESVAALRRSAGALLGHVTIQIVLGGLAFFLVSRRAGQGAPPPSEVWIATLHQTVGALLLGNVVLINVWSRRLLLPAPGGVAESA